LSDTNKIGEMFSGGIVHRGMRLRERLSGLGGLEQEWAMEAEGREGIPGR
jgi:hypothetical protein